MNSQTFRVLSSKIVFSFFFLSLTVCPMLASPPVDFDGDRKSDLSVYRFGTCWVLNSGTNTVFVTAWGNPSIDSITSGDFDGDGKTDHAVYRRTSGEWWIRRSSDGQTSVVRWGAANDRPVPADYDGDGKSDIAVFRPDDGIWYILPTAAGAQPRYVRWGRFGDQPVPADYDGDGKEDIAVFRVTENNWYIIDSSTGVYRIINFGYGGCCSRTAVPADYTGDGKADLAHYIDIDGFWRIRRSEDGVVVRREFALNSEPPVYVVAADYDGDGKTDLGLFHRGRWYTHQSLIGTQVDYFFGQSGDRPVQNAAFANQTE